MTAVALRRPMGQRSLSARAWAVLAAVLTKLAELDKRTAKVEPFGL
ncbi:MAG: hypothetical protein WC807_15600 [Hyphomicrobium sp.]